MKPPSLSSPTAARLLAAALLAASASPALAVTPFKMRIPVGPIAAAAPAPDISIAGYNPLTGMFQSPVSSFTWDCTSYAIPSGTAFGFTGPVTLTPAVTAGEAVKAALQGSPGAPGTLAEGWLANRGMGWTAGEWLKTTATYCAYWGGVLGCGSDPASSASAWLAIAGGPWYGTPSCNGDALSGNCHWTLPFFSGDIPYFRDSVQTVPAVPGDWDALPDPIPAAGAELPYAPYMPSGVAVQNNFTITDLNTGTVHHCTNGGCD